jgi:hypothetical protein
MHWGGGVALAAVVGVSLAACSESARNPLCGANACGIIRGTVVCESPDPSKCDAQGTRYHRFEILGAAGVELTGYYRIPGPFFAALQGSGRYTFVTTLDSRQVQRIVNVRAGQTTTLRIVAPARTAR